MFGKFFSSNSQIIFKFGLISFQEYVSKGPTHTFLYFDLVYRLRRTKVAGYFISSGSKIVKDLRLHQYDPAIIERTMCLVFGPLTALKRCILITRLLGVYDGPCPNILRGHRALILVPSFFLLMCHLLCPLWNLYTELYTSSSCVSTVTYFISFIFWKNELNWTNQHVADSTTVRHYFAVDKVLQQKTHHQNNWSVKNQKEYTGLRLGFYLWFISKLFWS